MIWLLGAIGLIYMLYLKIWVIGTVFVWIRNGFNFRRTWEELEEFNEIQRAKRNLKR